MNAFPSQELCFLIARDSKIYFHAPKEKRQILWAAHSKKRSLKDSLESKAPLEIILLIF